MNVLFIALAPVLVIALYVYFRDKYEKEPWKLLLTALIIGALLTVPVVIVERVLYVFMPSDKFKSLAYSAFVVAGLTEEGFKFLAFLLLIWRNRNFNEKFDGIVYAVFISLGFAGIENILYVSQGGYALGLTRALTAVPAHALFGITMGYYFGLARFYPQKRFYFVSLALLIPILLHGMYDFCLMAQIPLLLVLFVPFILYLWYSGFKKMRDLSSRSAYRNDL